MVRIPHDERYSRVDLVETPFAPVAPFPDAIPMIRREDDDRVVRQMQGIDLVSTLPTWTSRNATDAR